MKSFLSGYAFAFIVMTAMNFYLDPPGPSPEAQKIISALDREGWRRRYGCDLVNDKADLMIDGITDQVWTISDMSRLHFPGWWDQTHLQRKRDEVARRLSARRLEKLP